MKKTLSILFLFIFLVASTELGELFKVDFLISHFYEHQNSSQDITFSEYIYHHYFSHGENDKDGEKDKNLPFNSHSEICSLIAQTPYIPTENFYKVEFQISSLNLKKQLVIHRVQSYCCDQNPIWQPPKIV